MYQHPLTAPGSSLREGVICGYENLWYSASLCPRKIGRDFGDTVLMGHKIFGMGSAADDPKHALVRAPFRDIGTELRDFTCELQAWDVCRRSRRWWILTHPLQKICTVDRGSTH